MASFIDTNVLLYAISANPGERAKSDVAIEVLRADGLVFSAQVFNEFIFRSTRPGGRALALGQALDFIAVWRRFPVVAVDLPLLDDAANVARLTNYSWWDALIVAAAIRAGCDRILTEDLQHGRVIDGVRIENPFRELA